MMILKLRFVSVSLTVLCLEIRLVECDLLLKILCWLSLILSFKCLSETLFLLFQHFSSKH